LKYLREYRTVESIGAGRSAVCESIQWAEDMLAKDKTFRLPDKKALKKASSSIEYIAADVTESPINRPKKPKRAVFRQEKRHTVKTQAIIERETKKIIDAQQAKGSGHETRAA
jgi:hypothetical protein